MSRTFTLILKRFYVLKYLGKNKQHIPSSLGSQVRPHVYYMTPGCFFQQKFKRKPTDGFL